MSTTGQLFIVSAPSGAGKTSLVKALLAKTNNLIVSISHTTRPMRPGEIDGKDYHFVERGVFKRLIEENRFLEHANVFDNYYGTSLQSVQDSLNEGTDVLLEIDWQGAQQVSQKIPDAMTLFILPPSKEALQERLKGRGQDSEAVIMRRTQDAVNEMRHYDQADYLIINDNFEHALAEFTAIITASRLRRHVQQQQQKQLLNALIS